MKYLFLVLFMISCSQGDKDVYFQMENTKVKVERCYVHSGGSISFIVEKYGKRQYVSVYCGKSDCFCREVETKEE